MAVIAVVQQLEKKCKKQDEEEKKHNKSMPWGAFVIGERREEEMKKQSQTFIKFQEQMRAISRCSTV